jgi:hypothetical protein
MDGYQIPLQFKNGLAYLPCRKPSESELGVLPHVVMTSDVDWDPSLYHNVIDNMDDFHDPTLNFTPSSSSGNQDSLLVVKTDSSVKFFGETEDDETHG